MLTVSANATATVQITGDCIPNADLSFGSCDYASAFAALVLNARSLEDGNSFINNSAELKLVQSTDTIGQGVRETQNRFLSVSLTNPTEQAMKISFSYSVQVDGQSVTPAVPELSRTAMMLVGLLLLGGAAARSRRNRR